MYIHFLYIYINTYLNVFIYVYLHIGSICILHFLAQMLRCLAQMLRRSCNKPSHSFHTFWADFLGCCHAFLAQKLDPKKRREVHCLIAVRADLAAERRE